MQTVLSGRIGGVSILPISSTNHDDVRNESCGGQIDFGGSFSDRQIWKQSSDLLAAAGLYSDSEQHHTTNLACIS